MCIKVLQIYPIHPARDLNAVLYFVFFDLQQHIEMPLFIAFFSKKKWKVYGTQ